MTIGNQIKLIIAIVITALVLDFLPIPTLTAMGMACFVGVLIGWFFISFNKE